jgi:hypothetical protein
MKVASYIFATLFILGGLFCLYIMYTAAGGLHGYAEFRWNYVWASRNDSLIYFLAGFGFLAAGIVILIRRLRHSSKKEAPQQG